VSRVSVLVWRDATTDPPPRKRIAVIATRRSDGRPIFTFADYVVTQPEMYSLWCEPVPPGEDAATTEDLVYAVGALEQLEREWANDMTPMGVEYARQAREVAARVRRATEQNETDAPDA